MNNKGFTFVELVICVAIVSIFAAIMIPALVASQVLGSILSLLLTVYLICIPINIVYVIRRNRHCKTITKDMVSEMFLAIIMGFIATFIFIYDYFAQKNIKNPFYKGQ
jgi:prepilin-type N-terminal cleavage/methylation domain-containing protein